MQLSCSEVSVTPNIFSKTEKLNDSSEILLIKKHKSSHKGETFSHWQNKCNKVSGNFLQKLQLGESSRLILCRNWFVQIALWKSLKYNRS